MDQGLKVLVTLTLMLSMVAFISVAIEDRDLRGAVAASIIIPLLTCVFALIAGGIFCAIMHVLP